MPSWTALTTTPGKAVADEAAALLETLDPAPYGVAVTEVEDGSGFWEVGGYFSEPPDAAGLALVEALCGVGAFVVSRVEDRDWVAQVRRELTPVQAGRFVVHGGHDRGAAGPNRIGLCIEAAMAFGTGHHGTTRGCLLLLDGLVRRGVRPRRVADIGCGTGVLAMAAARVWHLSAVASDIDPVATATARENTRANNVGSRLRTVTAAGFMAPGLHDAAPYDLIFANILAAPLRRLAPEMARHLAPGGHAILSGLLTSQVAGVEAVYRGWRMRRVGRVTLGDWSSLLMRRW